MFMLEILKVPLTSHTLSCVTSMFVIAISYIILLDIRLLFPRLFNWLHRTYIDTYTWLYKYKLYKHVHGTQHRLRFISNLILDLYACLSHTATPTCVHLYPWPPLWVCCCFYYNIEYHYCSPIKIRTSDNSPIWMLMWAINLNGSVKTLACSVAIRRRP